MLHLRLLGGLVLEYDGRALAPPEARRARALLAWLALHPGVHRRATLAARLWPDLTDTAARASLRTSLHELRRALGPAAGHLAATRDEVALRDVAVDALETDPGPGELLAGLDDEWVLAARDHLAERRMARLAARAAEAERGGDLAAALAAARQRASLDPLSESAGREVVRLLAATGDRAAALVAFERLRGDLREALGIPPSAATRELVEGMLREDDRAVSPPGLLQPPPGAGLWQPALPPLLARRRTGPFVGRTEPLRRLRDALQLARAGERRLLAVTGEAGVGKSRLAAELAAGARDDGATVLHGRWFPDATAPFGAFAEALRPTDAAPALRALLGDLAAGAAADPEGARWRLFEAVDQTLAELASDQPVVLVLDDAQWADPGSLRLLAHIARSAAPARLLLLATVRAPDPTPTAAGLAALLADLEREGLAGRLVLGALARAEVAALTEGRLGRADDVLAGELHARSGGNPFLAVELLGGLERTGALPGRTPADVPERVQQAVEGRLTRLAPEVREVLLAAAVAGGDVELALLGRLGGLVAGDPLPALEEAAAAGLLREDPSRPGTFEIVHPLIREALEATATPSRRARWHAALGRAQPDRPAAAARHLLLAAEAGASSAAEAAEAALVAADADLRQLGYESAAAGCTRALGLRGLDPAARARLLLAAGEARQRAGDPPGAAAAFTAASDAARAAGDAELLARAALGPRGVGAPIVAVDPARVAVLEEALAAQGPAPSALRAHLLARLAIALYYGEDREARRRAAAQAVAEAEAVGEAGALAAALDARRVALWTPAHLAERRATTDRLAAIARDAGDPAHELRALGWLVVDLLEAGDVPGVDATIARYERLAGSLRLPGFVWWGPTWRAMRATLADDLNVALALIDVAEDLGRHSGDANAALMPRIQRLHVSRERGDRPDAHALAEVEAMPLGPGAAYAWRTYAVWARAELGDLARASEHVRELTADDCSAFNDDMNFLSAVSEIAEPILRLGESGAAERLLALAAPYAPHFALDARAANCYGSLELPLGLLAAAAGRSSEAEARLERAVATNAAAGARAWERRARAHLAAVRTAS